MKLNDLKYPLDTTLLAAAVDRLSLLVWAMSKDASNGLNRPKSIVAQLFGETEEKEIVGFDTPEDFERERERILREVNRCRN